MPRFVILEHDFPERHWDLMLEVGPILRTWRLMAAPGSGITVEVEPSFDHRPFYLEYEGPVSGERGSVTRWDAGHFDWVIDEPDRVIVDLVGGRLRGHMVLARTLEEKWSLTVEPNRPEI